MIVLLVECFVVKGIHMWTPRCASCRHVTALEVRALLCNASYFGSLAKVDSQIRQSSFAKTLRR